MWSATIWSVAGRRNPEGRSPARARPEPVVDGPQPVVEEEVFKLGISEKRAAGNTGVLSFACSIIVGAIFLGKTTNNSPLQNFKLWGAHHLLVYVGAGQKPAADKYLSEGVRLAVLT